MYLQYDPAENRLTSKREDHGIGSLEALLPKLWGHTLLEREISLDEAWGGPTLREDSDSGEMDFPI